MSTIQISSDVKRSNRANLGPARPTIILKDGMVVNVSILRSYQIEMSTRWWNGSRRVGVLSWLRRPCEG